MLLAPLRRGRGRVLRRLRAVALGLCVGAGGALFAATPSGVSFEEALGLTWLFTVRGPIAPPPDVAVVSLDKNSARELGLPAQPRRWPRTVQARLVEAIDRHGASAIGIDLILSERGRRADDAALATAIAESGKVVLFEYLERRREPITIGETRISGGLWIEQSHPPIPELAAAAAAVAPFPLPKVGASVKQFWSFKRAAGDAPTLPAVMLQLHELDAYQQWVNALEGEAILEIGQVPFMAGGGGGGMVEAMRASRGAYRALAGAGGTSATLTSPPAASPSGKSLAHDRADDRGHGGAGARAIAELYTGPDNHYLNFYGPPGTIPIIPFARLLVSGSAPEATGPPLDLTGKSVFVGVAELDDPGQPDGFYSVFSRADGVDLSGVEIAATAFANLLSGRGIDPASPLGAGAILFAFGLALGIGALLMPATVVVPSAIAAAALYALAAQALFNRYDAWLPLATPVLLQMPLALLAGLLGQYLLVHRQRQSISRAIGYYLPEKIAEGLRDGGVLAPNALGETVYATCLASDLENFTTTAETMTPDAVAKYLNAYFEAVAEPIRRHGADVVEFRADGIMCAWTASRADSSVHAHACDAALDVVGAVARFHDGRPTPGSPTRLGIHAGWIYVGHAGGGGRYAYSIVGDIANTASRIEGLNRLVGTAILASETVAGTLGDFALRPLGRFRLRGKLEPIGIVEVLARQRETTAEQDALREGFAAALALFQACQWDEAAMLFDALRREHPGDGPSAFYAARCRILAHAVPDDPDPTVIRLDAK